MPVFCLFFAYLAKRLTKRGETKGLRKLMDVAFDISLYANGLRRHVKRVISFKHFVAEENPRRIEYGGISERETAKRGTGSILVVSFPNKKNFEFSTGADVLSRF